MFVQEGNVGCVKKLVITENVKLHLVFQAAARVQLTLPVPAVSLPAGGFSLLAVLIRSCSARISASLYNWLNTSLKSG
jgi:hypothetical protein